jgi:hypothetical protein
MEVLKDGTELHLVSFCLADAELRLAGADGPAFAALMVKYADVLGRAPTIQRAHLLCADDSCRAHFFLFLFPGLQESR